MMTEFQRILAVHDHARALYFAQPVDLTETPPDWRPFAMRAICNTVGGLRTAEIVERIRAGYAVSEEAIRRWLREQERA